MRFAVDKVICVIFLVSVASATYGQSLGDVARQERHKQQAKKAQAQTAPKVITNEDLAGAESSATSSATESKAGNNEDSSSGPSSATKPAEQWKAEIQTQKQSIANLQSRIDKLNSSIHFVDSSLIWNGAQHNERQAKKQEEVQRMQTQLDEARKKLEDMQESARKEGYGNGVYEP